MALKPTKPSKLARNKRKTEQRKNPQELRKAALNLEAMRLQQKPQQHASSD